MDPATPTEALLAACRFICSHADLVRLLPGVEFEVPVPQDLGGDLGHGWPLRPSGRLTSALFEYVSAVTHEALQGGPCVETNDYCVLLESSLLEAVTQAPGARLDTIVWLWLLDLVPRLLNGESETLQSLERVHPDIVARHRGPLDQLALLGDRDPALHVALKRKIIKTIDASHELVAADVRQRAGESSEHLLTLSSDTPLVLFVSPDALYRDFDFALVFSGRNLFSEYDSFVVTRRLVQAIIDATWNRRLAERAGASECWALSQFVPDGLIARAQALDPSALHPSAGEALPARLAALGSIQPDFVDYLLHHSDQFCVDAETASRYSLSEDQLELLRDPARLSLRAPSYREVVEELLRWDAINTARGFVRPVESIGQGFLFRGLPVGANVFVLDLERGVVPQPPTSRPVSRAKAAPDPEGVGLFEELDAAFPEGTPSGVPPVDEPADENLFFGELFSANSGFQGFDATDLFESGSSAPTRLGEGASLPEPSPGRALSLLGVLEVEFVETLREHDLKQSSPITEGRRGGGVAKPDFGSLFDSYVIFPVGRLGTKEAAIGIARRTGDQLFDLHLFPVHHVSSWGPEEAIEEFMRAKIDANFVPLAFEYEDIPGNAGAMETLSLQRLHSAFDRVVYPDLEIS